MGHKAKTIDTCASDQLGSIANRVSVRLGARSYDIIIRERALDLLRDDTADRLIALLRRLRSTHGCGRTDALRLSHSHLPQ